MTLDQGVSRMVGLHNRSEGSCDPSSGCAEAVATRQAKNFGCRWSRVRRGDDIVFIFKGDKGDEAANLFAVACGAARRPTSG
jgi:hypothetical protein